MLSRHIERPEAGRRATSTGATLLPPPRGEVGIERGEDRVTNFAGTAVFEGVIVDLPGCELLLPSRSSRRLRTRPSLRLHVPHEQSIELLGRVRVGLCFFELLGILYHYDRTQTFITFFAIYFSFLFVDPLLLGLYHQLLMLIGNSFNVVLCILFIRHFFC